MIVYRCRDSDPFTFGEFIRGSEMEYIVSAMEYIASNILN